MNMNHGECSLSVIGDVIHIKCKGVFNEYGVKAGFKESKQIIDSFNGDKFAIIADYLEVEGATPEAFEEVNSNNIWLFKQNIRAKAVVINSAVFRAIDLKRVPAQENINTKFFDSIEKATEWLLQQS
jgi:hypothetical protein